MAEGSDYVPLCRISALLPFITFCERVGAPVARLLDQSGLPGHVLESPEALFPLANGFKFVASLAGREGLPHLGFTVGIDTRFQDLGAFGRLVLDSSTLHEALAKVSAIVHLYNSAQYIWRERRQDRTLLCTAYRPRLNDGWRFGEQYTLTLLINCIRAATGKDWLPLEIHLEASLFDLVQGKAGILGMSNIRRSSVSALVVDNALLDRPMARPPRHGTVATDADLGVLASSAPPTDLAASVAHLSRLYMGDGPRQIERIASTMGLSVRTLQRRLAEHKMDFSGIAERTRFDLAVALLADPANSIVDVAYDLGYSDVSSFSRAFRRWSGASPGRFRRRAPTR